MFNVDNLKMKKIIFRLLMLVGFYSNAQEIKINWSDVAGREFSITAPSGYFSYGMISGDKVEYGDKYSSNQGDIIKIGDSKIEYADKYSEFFRKIHCCPIKVNKKEAIKMASQLKS
jgi:hypothetical protein